jgi:hypothetical protein
MNEMVVEDFRYRKPQEISEEEESFMQELPLMSFKGVMKSK